MNLQYIANPVFEQTYSGVRIKLEGMNNVANSYCNVPMHRFQKKFKEEHKTWDEDKIDFESVLASEEYVKRLICCSITEIEDLNGQYGHTPTWDIDGEFKKLSNESYKFIMKFFDQIVKEDIASQIAEYARLNINGSFVTVDDEKKK